LTREEKEIIAYNISEQRKLRYPGHGGGKKCAAAFGIPPQQWSPWESGSRTPDDNRELSCLVAVELKIGRFKSEHLGQLEFYLEALDRDVKKPNENPSVGLILCARKDDEVVEYALSRSMSPALIADYQTHLPQKELLETKLRELRDLAETEDLAKE
jgi:hypothetical protein